MRNWRINLILLFIFVFAAALIRQLVFLQVRDYGFYKALALGQQNVSEEIAALRGEIFFNDGKTKLATNYVSKDLHVNPVKLLTNEAHIENLALILNLDKDSLIKALNEKTSDIALKANLTQKEEDEVKKLKIDGAYILEQAKRLYPQKTLASDVVGYVGGEGNGQYGLEEHYDQELSGKMGFFGSGNDSGGKMLFFGFDKYLEPQNGENLVLTLDYNIQFYAEKLLKEAKEQLKFTQGSIIVIDPNSGAVKALADYPGYDPNEYSSYKDLGVFKNSIIQEIFEPGSVMKPFTMASAINEGKITPETTYIDTGQLKVSGYTIANFANRVYGQRTMTQVLENSINTGAAFAENELGDPFFLKYLKNFGFFKKTGIDLSGEVYSENKTINEGSHLNYVTASFGQGIAITPIQLACAFSMIANGGKVITPYVVEKEINIDRIIETNAKLTSGNQIISDTTTSDLRKMLASVIENGFSKKAKIPGYYIAGKSGTAQIPWTSLGVKKAGYSDQTIQSFIGFAPAFNPKFLILVKLDNPETSTAEYSAMPIFRELTKYIIDYWQVPPDYQ